MNLIGSHPAYHTTTPIMSRTAQPKRNAFSCTLLLLQQVVPMGELVVKPSTVHLLVIAKWWSLRPPKDPSPEELLPVTNTREGM